MIRKIHLAMTGVDAELTRTRCGRYGIQDGIMLRDINHGKKLEVTRNDAKVTCARVVPVRTLCFLRRMPLDFPRHRPRSANPTIPLRRVNP